MYSKKTVHIKKYIKINPINRHTTNNIQANTAFPFISFFVGNMKSFNAVLYIFEHVILLTKKNIVTKVIALYFATL